MRRKEKIYFIFALCVFSAFATYGFEKPDTIPFDDLEFELDEVVVKGDGVKKLKYQPGNTELITAVELTRAACCNLGESFTTNPSVDVSYSDAATGARQIKLLGLSGSYVQMLNENIPSFRGISSLYGLNYIPGPWLQSIQVSKGASSVKNGFESITGQINVELKKPQNDSQLNVNAYGDSNGKVEINADGNLHFGDKWSGGLLLHGENTFATHDRDNDGFVDMPRVRQATVMNRWAYLGNRYVFQIAAKGLLEKRESGQIGMHSFKDIKPYIIEIKTKRLDFFTKNAYIYDREKEGNVALILAGSIHEQNSNYGLKIYDGLQYEFYTSLMYERKWTEKHHLSAGISYQLDNYDQQYRLIPSLSSSLLPYDEREGVAGIYGQYTYNLNEKLIAMGGIRADLSSRYGVFMTPRLHLRFNPNENLSFHASAGTGRKSPHPLAEYSYLFASSREIYLPKKLEMEKGFNSGAGLTWSFFVGSRRFNLSAEYYYTRFTSQMAADLNRDPHAAYIVCNGKSIGNAFQAEADLDILDDMKMTLAYRLTDVKVDYGNGRYIMKPLTSRHKGLLTLSYTPFMGKWQFDGTLSANGGGNMPTPYAKSNGTKSWGSTYPAYLGLNLQVTWNLKHWSLYVGGENLTGYRQKNAIIDASDPWGKNFDATMIWGPLEGAMVYVGFRYNLTKY